jgi:hypothetical protein
METAKRRNYPYYIILGYTPLRGTLGILIVAPSDGCPATAPLLASTQALRSRRVSSASKLLGAPGSHLRSPSLSSWFCGPTKLPGRFCGDPPQTPRADSGREPLPCTSSCHNIVLLFLSPSPHLTLLATGSLETNLLVSPLLGALARHRPFALALHLHQHKSSRNLHLQYSAKSQSTPRCQSLITARSDQPPVLGRSSPQSPP